MSLYSIISKMISNMYFYSTVFSLDYILVLYALCEHVYSTVFYPILVVTQDNHVILITALALHENA